MGKVAGGAKMIMGGKKRHCYNCKFAGPAFKVGKLTHHHCEDEGQYNQEKFDNGEFTAWDTLRVFADVCDNHRLKVLEQRPAI